jgi:hypothetical protein
MTQATDWNARVEAIRSQVNASTSPVAHLFHGILDLIAVPVEAVETAGEVAIEVTKDIEDVKAPEGTALPPATP